MFIQFINEGFTICLDRCMPDNVCRTKERLSMTPILRGPNQAFPFHIYSNASDIDIGTVLGQHECQNPYDIYYVSKNLSPGELN